MAELGFNAVAHTNVSDLAGKKGGFTYSIDMIQEIKRLRPRAELYYLIGMDSYLTMPTWKDAERLFSLCHWIVATRAGYEIQLPHLLSPKMADQFNMESTFSYVHASGKKLIFKEIDYLDLSSSEIRRKIAASDRSVTEDLPPLVYSYIETHRLYQKASVEEQSAKEEEIKNVSR